MPVFSRVAARWKRFSSRNLGCRGATLRNSDPLISFTFDDFPRSALHCGGTTLETVGARGTYFTSLGLMGGTEATGTMFIEDDLMALLFRGHEIGCHTYDHYDAARTSTDLFEKSIIRNREALARFAPSASMQTLSYPIDVPRPRTKMVCGRHYAACRAGGQKINSGRVDLNSLQAFFLEQCSEDRSVVKNLIDKCVAVRGWLIFATHDIAEKPTRFGVTPAFFESVVAYAANSGARIATMREALTQAAPQNGR